MPEADFYDHFAQFGLIESCLFPIQKGKRQLNRGFGLIKYVSAVSLEKVMNPNNIHTLGEAVVNSKVRCQIG